MPLQRVSARHPSHEWWLHLVLDSEEVVVGQLLSCAVVIAPCMIMYAFSSVCSFVIRSPGGDRGGPGLWSPNVTRSRPVELDSLDVVVGEGGGRAQVEHRRIRKSPGNDLMSLGASPHAKGSVGGVTRSLTAW
eukprot:4799974-Amphidinium_carterae.1